MLVRTSAYFPDTLGYLIFPLKASFLPYHCLLPGGGLQASNLIVLAPFLLSPTPLHQEAAEIYSMPALGLEVFQTLIKLSLSFQNKQLNKKKNGCDISFKLYKFLINECVKVHFKRLYGSVGSFILKYTHGGELFRPHPGSLEKAKANGTKMRK